MNKRRILKSYGFVCCSCKQSQSKASLKGTQGLGSPVAFNDYFLKGPISPLHLYHFPFHLLFLSFHLYFNLSLIPQSLGLGDEREVLSEQPRGASLQPALRAPGILRGLRAAPGFLGRDVPSSLAKGKRNRGRFPACFRINAQLLSGGSWLPLLGPYPCTLQLPDRDLLL